MGYDLGDYVEVSERIVQFREKHPEGSLQSEIVRFPEDGCEFFVVKAYAYRTPDDPRPGIGYAQEPVPGKTNFTRDSELMNAETSAWGRAIVAALAADTKKGIASADEVRARKDSAGSAQAGPKAVGDEGSGARAAASPPRNSRGGADDAAQPPKQAAATPAPSLDQSPQREGTDGKGRKGDDPAPPAAGELWSVIQTAVDNGLVKKVKVQMAALELCSAREGCPIPGSFPDVSKCPPDVLRELIQRFDLAVAA